MKKEFLGNMLSEDYVCQEEPEEPMIVVTASGMPKLRSIKQFLALPFFSLKRSDMEVFTFKSNDGKEKIKIVPSFYGRPTVYDKDFIIYIISYIQEQLDKGVINATTPNCAFVFDAHELLENIGRKPTRLNNKIEEELKATGDRLFSTIETTVEFGGNKITTACTYIQHWTVVKDKSTGTISLVFKLTDWLYASIVKSVKPEILTLDKDYYQIPIGMERRIYEILRQKMGIFYANGNKPLAYYQINLKDLKALCGSTSDDYKFKYVLNEIIKANNGKLKHWNISIKKDIFYARNMSRIKNAKTLKEQGEMIRHAQSVK